MPTPLEELADMSGLYISQTKNAVLIADFKLSPTFKIGDHHLRLDSYLRKAPHLAIGILTEIERAAHSEMNVTEGTVHRLAWGNGRIFRWKFEEGQDEKGHTLHIWLHGEAAGRGLRRRLSLWWLNRSAQS